MTKNEKDTMDMRSVAADALAQVGGNHEDAIRIMVGALIIVANGGRSPTGTIADVIVNLHAHLQLSAEMARNDPPDSQLS